MPSDVNPIKTQPSKVVKKANGASTNTNSASALSYSGILKGFMNANINFEQSTAMVTAIDVLRSHMDNRFIDAEVLTNKRFEQLESVMNQKFEKADERFVKIDQQLIAIRNDISQSNALHQKDISKLHDLYKSDKGHFKQMMAFNTSLLIIVIATLFTMALKYPFGF